MALPLSFQTPEEFFEESLHFYEEYEYLFNFPNTDILILNILDKITINNDIDVFEDHFDLTKEEDEFLVAFFLKLNKLQVHHQFFEEDSLHDHIVAPLGPKKKHEIINLAKEIKEICEEEACDVVVDFGSGLGYLDQQIHETTNYKVLGIECNENHYIAAKKRQRKYHENSIEYVKYIKHTVTQHSHDNIQEYLQDKFPNYRNFCITGLHACADLTIDAINLFLKMQHAKALVLMPCCYHKMSENGGFFKYFPLSNILKDIFKRKGAQKYLRVPFLRLAAQPPSGSDKLKDLVFNLLSRAILQLYAHRHNYKLKRNKRKAVKTKVMDCNFAAYIQDATTNGFKLIKNEPQPNSDKVQTSTFDLEELMTLWNEITPAMFKKAGVFILLQNYLQPVIENFVLFDRLVYLQENNVICCKFKKILNEKMSPRCLALVAQK